MSTIAFGAAITLGLYLVIYLVFRKGPDHNRPPSEAQFSTYDGGHDGLSQHGKDGGE